MRHRLSIAVPLRLLFVTGWCLLSVAAAISARAVDFTVYPVAMSGELAPDGVNTFRSFNSFNSPLLNDAGQVAFSASLSDQTVGIFRSDGSSRVEIVRQGEAAPIGDGTLNFYSGLSFNQQGELAFHSMLFGTSGGIDENNGIFLGDGSSLREIAREGKAAPDGNGVLAQLAAPLLNDAGDIAFIASLRNTSGGSTDDEGVFVSDGNLLRQIVREGQPAPDGDGNIGSLTPLALNDRGEIAYMGGLTGTAAGPRTNYGVFFSDGTTLRTILRKGDPTPDSDATLSPFLGQTALNNAGEVLFRSLISFDNGETATGQGLYRSDGETLVEIARAGQLAPDGNGVLAEFPGQFRSALNDAGQALFQARYTGTSAGGRDDHAIYRSDGPSLVEIVRDGQVAQGGDRVFSVLPSANPVMNESGQVAFDIGLVDTQSPFALVGTAVYLFDDSQGLVQVARTGQPLFGSTILTLHTIPGGGRGGGSMQQVGLSNAGPTRVLFQFLLADGRSGIALWTLVPEPTSLVIVAIGAATIGIVSGWPLSRQRRDARETDESRRARLK